MTHVFTISKVPPPNPAFDLVASHLAEVTIELFGAYALPLQRSSVEAPPVWNESAGAATIGFVGENVRGALTILALESAVLLWREAIGAEEGELADVLGEFSNMLLGRLKARLLAEGVPIAIATPTAATGCGLRLSVPPGQSRWLVFEGTGWQANVRLAASFELGFARLTTDNRHAPALAGEAVLF